MSFASPYGHMRKKAWIPRSVHPVDWLYSLDSYTNAAFGTTRSMAVTDGWCLTCGAAVDVSPQGLCARCTAKRIPDTSQLRLFRRPGRHP